MGAMESNIADDVDMIPLETSREGERHGRKGFMRRRIAVGV
jgi:hypothetical protein